jgi:beta-xylosidase
VREQGGRVTVTRVDRVDPAYRDPTRTIDERVEDLLGRMTRDEKVAQLGSAWVFELADGAELSQERAAELLELGIGQITRISGASRLDNAGSAAFANAVQAYLLERTRLGIPAIVHEEICSGLMAREATVFPQAIGLASTWEPELAFALADAIRVQMRAVGAHQGLAPVLDVCRDPRWGRTEETFGEDPYLVARMGVAFVQGLQGDDLSAGVIATAKHFVGYSASEGGMNWAPAGIPARVLREVYLHPFEAVVRVAGVQSVMNAYNELDGLVCAADRELLTSLLRDEWGFDGCVVADYFSVRQLADYHRLAESVQHAAAMALEAGLDVELPATDCYGAPLLDALDSGLVGEETLDTAVGRVLRSKFELGLFDQPFVDVAAAAGVGGTATHRSLAREVARKSLVLLANDGVLPLAPDVGSVAVIGPNARNARNLLGDYVYQAHLESRPDLLESGHESHATWATETVGEETAPAALSVVDALRERLGSRVAFAQGCEVNSTRRDGFEEAVRIAAAAEVAVLVMGDKSGLTEECTSGESRDRASLDLPGVQEELVRAVLATGTPVVLVLAAGRPTGSAALLEQCAAVVMAWLPGEEGAAAIAEVLTGEVSPSGKLPISFPRGVGQVPIFYGHKISGGRSHWKGDYVDLPSSPLYPFGHGLSYTTFALSDASVREGAVTSSGSIVVDVSIANTGERLGGEVVQLYVRDPHASLTRPVLELKSFKRVELAPGEARTLTFRVPVGQLGFYDRDLVYVVEPGLLELFVGTSSEDLISAGTATVVEEPGAPAPTKLFDGSVSVA